MSRTTERHMRLAMATVVTAALFMSFGTTAWGASKNYDLVVNTGQDIVPDPAAFVAQEQVVSNPPNTDNPASVRAWAASCLGEEHNNGGQVRHTLWTAEQGNQPPTSGPLNGSAVNVTRTCSLRMALELAPLLRTGAFDSSTPPKSVTVKFDRAKIDGPIQVADTGLGGRLTLLPPLVDPLGSSNPLGNGTEEGAITIDGCSGVDSPKGPCVDLRLPQSSLTIPQATSGGPEDIVPGLVVAAPNVTIKGIAFLGGAPAIAAVASAETSAKSGYTSEGLKIANSYFGMNTAGVVEKLPANEGDYRVGVLASGRGAQIGGSAEDGSDRNVFAAGEAGVVIAGGSGNHVEGNWFGTDSTGAKSANKGRPLLRTAIRVTGAYAQVDRLDDLVLQQAGHAAGTSVASPVPANTLPGTRSVRGVENTIGGRLTDSVVKSGTCSGACNLIAFTSVVGIDVGGPPLYATEAAGAGTGDPPAPTSTKIQGNWFGLEKDGVGRAGNGVGVAGPAISVSNGAADTTIGGADPEGNVISNSGGPGVRVWGLDTSDPSSPAPAGAGTLIERNVGLGNHGMLIDLGNEAFGNDPSQGASGGVQAPEVTHATPVSVEGTAAPRASVHVYLVQGASGGQHPTGHGDVARFLVRVTARADGTWTAAIPANALVKDQRVTATANAGGGTSELAANRVVEAVPQVKQDTGQGQPVPTVTPPPPAPTPDHHAPTLTSVFGRSVPAGAAPLTVRLPAALSGNVRDASGVAHVEVALALPVGAPGRNRKQTCAFVDFKRARYVRRYCTQPLFARARGTAAWRLPITPKVRRLLKRGRQYVLYVRSANTLGNSATKTLRVRFR